MLSSKPMGRLKSNKKLDLFSYFAFLNKKYFPYSLEMLNSEIFQILEDMEEATSMKCGLFFSYSFVIADQEGETFKCDWARQWLDFLAKN